VLWLSETHGEAIRTGTDSWLRWLLQEFGMGAMCWPPIVIAAIFVLWNATRLSDRPKDVLGIWLGMAVESVAFALILWGLGRIQQPLLEFAGVTQVPNSGLSSQRLAQAVSFLGAGIYEELLFRLLLYPILLKMLTATDMSPAISMAVAMCLSAVLFSAAHHVGPYGEAFEPRVFIFRGLAGLYFAILFQFRGFGIAVGTHACYDVLVGVAMV
jgi:membrane protease YdiL (CAAX protease family)